MSTHFSFHACNELPDHICKYFLNAHLRPRVRDVDRSEHEWLWPTAPVWPTSYSPSLRLTELPFPASFPVARISFYRGHPMQTTITQLRYLASFGTCECNFSNNIKGLQNYIFSNPSNTYWKRCLLIAYNYVFILNLLKREMAKKLV